MTRIPDQLWTALQPEDDTLSPDTVVRIQVQRLLTLAGAVLVPAFGLLHGLSNRPTVDPSRARLAISGLFLLLFFSSYASRHIRRNYVPYLRGLLYVLGGWSVLLASLNHWSGGYVTSLLVTYAALILVVGTGAKSIRPALWFAGINLGLVVLMAPFDLSPYTSPALLLTGMATIGAAEVALLRVRFSTHSHLRTPEERLQGLARSVPGIVFEFASSGDDSYTATFVSDRSEALLGLAPDPDRFLAEFMNRVPSPHRERLIESITRAINEGTPWRLELPFERSDGTRIWLLAACTPERRGENVVLDGLLVDITDRKRAEKAVDEREQKAEALCAATERLVTGESGNEVADRLEEIVDVIFDYPFCQVHLHEEDGGNTYGRPNGSRRENGVGGDSHGPMEPSVPEREEPRPSWVCDDRSEAKQPNGYEDVQSGLRIPIGHHGALALGWADSADTDPFDVRLVEILAMHAAAVLDRIEREEALVSASAETEQASQLKSAMLANMSHEFRTPLTSITGFSEILASELEGQLATFSEQIHHSGRRLLSTLDAVLELSELEAGAYDLEPEPVNLRRVVETTLDDRRPDAVEEDITLQLDLPPLDVDGCWHKEAVRRIVECLLDNALKFTPEGGAIMVRVREEGMAAVLEVEDTGVGIREELLPEVFQAFRQESSGLSREFEGSGLGLSIAKALVDVLDGEITVRSEKNEGTRFTVSLPRKDPVPAAA